jgi:CDP-paratose 2-epimerase
MQDKRILITGGAGFIGINAAKFFFDAGWDVTLFDNVSRKGADTNLAFITEYTAGKCRNVVADVRTDTEQLRALAETNDVILHLAAQVAVTTSVSNPREDFEINALGTFNVLEAVRLSLRKPALLYASTNKVYGNLAVVGTQEGERRYDFTDGLSGVTEGHPLDFHSPYGCSKGTADQYVRRSSSGNPVFTDRISLA